MDIKQFRAIFYTSSN